MEALGGGNVKKKVQKVAGSPEGCSEMDVLLERTEQQIQSERITKREGGGDN